MCDYEMEGIGTGMWGLHSKTKAWIVKKKWQKEIEGLTIAASASISPCHGGPRGGYTGGEHLYREHVSVIK